MADAPPVSTSTRFTRVLGTVFKSAEGLMGSPGAARLLFTNTSVRKAPIPRRSAVAVPVSGDTDGPLAPRVNPELTWGRLLRKSSVRTAPWCCSSSLSRTTTGLGLEALAEDKRDPVTTISISDSSPSPLQAGPPLSTPNNSARQAPTCAERDRPGWTFGGQARESSAAQCATHGMNAPQFIDANS